MNDSVKELISTVEYFALPETTQPTQLIDGEIIEMPSPTPEHQDIVLEIAYFLKTLAKGRGWRVFVAPLDVEFCMRNTLVAIQDTNHALHPHHARLGG